jgi:transcriptional regulator with XRE-family HTH domain
MNNNEATEIINKMLDTFNKKIEEKKLSNVYLAQKLGMSSQNVGQILSGKMRLRTEVMLQLMSILEIETFFVENPKNQMIEFLEFLLQNKEPILQLSEGLNKFNQVLNTMLGEGGSKENRTRNEVLQLRYTEAEKLEIKEFSNEQGKSTAEIILDLIREKNQKDGRN